MAEIFLGDAPDADQVPEAPLSLLSGQEVPVETVLDPAPAVSEGAVAPEEAVVAEPMVPAEEPAQLDQQPAIEMTDDGVPRLDIYPLQDDADEDWVTKVYAPKVADRADVRGPAGEALSEEGIDPRNLLDAEAFDEVTRQAETMVEPYKRIAAAAGDITWEEARFAWMETGRAIVAGAGGAVQGFFDVTKEAAELIESVAGSADDYLGTNLYVTWGDKSDISSYSLSLKDHRPDDPYQHFTIPNFWQDPETELGQMGAGIMQFVSAMAAVSLGTLATIPYRTIRWMSYGGFADALFDPEEGNFSTMLMDLGVPRYEVLQFLGTPVGKDAEASERLAQRLKQVIEGSLISLPFDLAPVLFSAFKSLKESGLASRAIANLQGTAHEAVMNARQRFAENKSPFPMGMSIEDVGPARLAEVRADLRQGSDVVADRLKVLVPEGQRVGGGGKYRVGQPDGRPWSELSAEELAAPGPGFRGSDADVERLFQEAVAESSAAAQKAAAETGMTVTLSAQDWDAALRLPLRAQLWYELSGEAFARRIPYLQTNSDEFVTFTDVVGVTSAREKPLGNLQRSLAILSQKIRGVPIDVDLTNPAGVQQALKRQGGEGSDAGARRTSVRSGNKTGHFSDTLALVGGADVPTPIPVNDVWVGRIFGVTDEQLMQYQSLHEPMAIFWNKMRDLVNETSPSQFPHESWQLQSRGWVSVRGAQSDYDQAMDTIVDQLNAAGIPGVTPEGVITEEALRHPDFVTALRPTVQAYRDAPKATIEFGTKRTATGARAAELLEQVRGRPDDEKAQRLYREYNQILTSAMYRSSRGGRNMWDQAYNHVMGRPPAADVSRIRAPTKERPLDIAGTFEGVFSPNIRVPLRDMSDDQVALFNAIIGTGLRQDAMAASRIRTIAADAEVAPGTVRGQSVFVETADDLGGGEIEEFYRALPDGFEISTERVPNGYMIDINPRFGDEGPVGITNAELKPATDLLEHRGLKFDTLYHQYSSVYNEASEFAGILAARKKELRDGAVTELVERVGLTRSEARRFLRGGGLGGETQSKHRAAERVRSTFTGRLGDLDESIAAAREISQGVEARVKDWTSAADEHLSKSNLEGRPPDIDAPLQPETAPPRAGLSNDDVPLTDATTQPKPPADPEAVLERSAADNVSVMADVENLPGREMWSKAFAKAVDGEASRLSPAASPGQITREHIEDNYDDFKRAIVRANLEAIPRHFKKLGWTVRHTSTSRGGRKSSRYLVSPDVSHSPDLNQERFEVRLSDHRLERPDDWHGESWDVEILVTGVEHQSPKYLVDEILNIYRTEHLHD
jgi:hypothetical protein